MGKNTSISIGSYFDSFINSEVESGRYSTCSEVVRAGLRLLDEKTKKMSIIDIELEKGRNSGEAIDFNFNDFIKKMELKHGG